MQINKYLNELYGLLLIMFLYYLVFGQVNLIKVFLKGGP